jgi:hypothetical protein
MGLVFAASAGDKQGAAADEVFRIVEAREPSVAISPQSGPSGTIVEVVASGFPAHAEVSVGMGPEYSEFSEVARGTASADGVYVAHVEVWAGPGTTLVFAASANGQRGAQSPNRFYVTEKTSAWILYTNAAYAVSFQRPSQWVIVPEHSDLELGDLSYAGDDGFFIVGALESPASIHEVAAGQASHALQPYGSDPTIETQVVAGQEARLIRPSADQYPSMKGQSALIVRYPRPVTIQGHAFNFLVLQADGDHIDLLAQSLSFVE